MAKLSFNRIANAALTGFVQSQAPVMVKGFMIEYLKNVTVQEACDHINQDKDLWSLVSDDKQNLIKKNIGRLGDISWLNSEWVIEAIRHDYPALASLFLGWDKAREWLDRQIATFHQETGS